MMLVKLFFSFIFVFLFISTTIDGALYRMILEERTGHKDQCYYKRSNKATRYFPVGTDTTDVDKCVKYECQRYDDKLMMIVASCGVLSADIPNCRIIEEKGKHYPDCCPKLACP